MIFVDLLRRISSVEARISRPDLTARITPSALALNLFYKTNSVNCTPKDFWGDQLAERKEDTYEAGS